MIYKIDDKYYIKVQGHYKECDMSLEDDELVIKPNGNVIEGYNVIPMQISCEEIKKQLQNEENKTVQEIRKQKKW